MDTQQLRQLKPKLRKFLSQFDDCFLRKDTRAHLPTYVAGQLSSLQDKSVEPIALKAGVAPRTLQEFLSQLKWDQDKLRDRLQDIVRTEHAGRHAIGIFDETSYVKKGDKTPGVKRQWCGAVGKEENCMVTVHLGYACGEFHCLLDGELFLLEDWSADRQRCREADIPEAITYRPKWQIAMERVEARRFFIETKNFYRKAIRVAMIDAMSDPVLEMLTLVTVAIALLAGSFLVLNKTIFEVSDKSPE